MADRMTTTTDDSGITVAEAKDGARTVSFTVSADADLNGILAAVRPWTTGGVHLVGNLADVQRLGAVLAVNDKPSMADLSDAVPAENAVTAEELKEAQKAS